MVDRPSAHNAAAIRAMPAGMSGETIVAARSRLGPMVTARWGSQRTTRALMAMRFIDEEQPALEELLVDENGSLALRGQDPPWPSRRP